MLRSLNIAATGMTAQQSQLDAISNNLANSGTAGYKRVRADFEDLMYQTIRAPGSATTSTTNSPTGVQEGSGVRLVSLTRLDAQGTIQQTGNPLDIAIEGRGYFVVQQADGTPAYTRAGTFKLDGTGRMVTPSGLAIEPAITVPPEATGVNIGADGVVTANIKGQTTPAQIGQMQIASFVNPAGLSAIGHNLFTNTLASGDPQLGTPGQDGRGTLLQSSLEHANVEVVEEMVALISTQRAYEINTKIITAADEMLRSASQLR